MQQQPRFRQPPIDYTWLFTNLRLQKEYPSFKRFSTVSSPESQDSVCRVVGDERGHPNPGASPIRVTEES